MACPINEKTYTYKNITLPKAQNLTTNERNNIMIQVVDTLLNSGLSNMNETIAFGIAGNIKAESEFNYTMIGDSGSSYGLCQWHDTRMEKLYEYCKSINKSPNTVEGQMQYLIYELKNSYKSVYDTISSPSYLNDIGKIAEYFCRHFEVPKNQNVICPARIALAKQVFNDYKRLKGQS
jgi:hypothetical protein